MLDGPYYGESFMALFDPQHLAFVPYRIVLVQVRVRVRAI